ncbi:MAG TPA: C40 family peptidase [Steroidobacteraceae bacterium]|nr:C40 family peptidase [Steroidobacteraceae bacterium]
MIRAALAAATLLLGACASTAQKNPRPPETPAAPVSAAPRIPAPDQRTLMVDGATAMLGQPYRFGGAEPGGFDCSGLVFYAAAIAGIRVPRTAAEQLNFGVAVRRGDLQEGDLIFMNLAHKELHVGLAIDRERFIHAPSNGGHVRIDSLAAAPYLKGFIGARRVIPKASAGL